MHGPGLHDLSVMDGLGASNGSALYSPLSDQLLDAVVDDGASNGHEAQQAAAFLPRTCGLS